MSQFAIVETLDEETWNTFVMNHPKGTIFHTPYMLEVFKATKHYYPMFLAAIDPAGEVLALLLAVRIQTLPDPLGSLSSRSIWYAEPICRDDELGVDALTAIIALHDRKMSSRALFTEVRVLWPSGSERLALERCDYDYKGYLNYIIDLQQPEKKLWSNMSKSCRENIRRSLKRNLRIEETDSPEAIDTLYHLLELTYERARVPLADRSLFEAAFRILHPRDMVRIYIVYYEEKPIAAAMLLVYKQMLFDWYSARDEVREVRPAECLHWHKIEMGHHQKYAIYDFGGAGWPGKPYGVRDFKARFGGELVNYGRYRKIYDPCKLAMAENAYELARSGIERYRDFKNSRQKSSS